MFVVALFVEILLVCYAYSKLNINYSESLTNGSSLVKCLANICDTYFRGDQFFQSITFVYENAVRFSKFRESMWKALLVHPKHTYLIISSNKEILFFKKRFKDFKNIVIEFTSLAELRKTIFKIKQLPFWNIRPNVVVFSTESVKHPKETANKIFDLLLEEGIIQVLVLFQDDNHLNLIKLYHYILSKNYRVKIDAFSFKVVEYSCENGKTSEQNYKHDKISDKMRERFTIKTRFQPIPPFVVMENNTVNPDNPGIEMLLLNTLAEQLKLKIHHTSISHTSSIHTNTQILTGDVFLNGTVTREFKELYDEKIDIIFGSFFQTYERMLIFSSSSSYYQHQLVWCVPRKGDEQSTPTIQKQVLLLVLLCFLILTLLIWMVNQKQKHRYSLHHVIYCSVSIFFAVSIAKQPKTVFLRYLVALLIIFSFLCDNIFTSSITSFLISKKTKLKYDTMKKIYDHNLTTYLLEKSYKFLTQEEIDGIPKALVEQRRIICRDFVRCLEQVAQGDSAFLTFKVFTQYYAPRIDISAIYCFDFLRSIPIGLITRKEFLLLEMFNKKIQDIVSAGLIHKWTRDLTTVPDWTLLSKERRLTIGEFTYLFQMVFCGYLLSFLVFLYEIGIFSKLFNFIIAK
ncbi:Ionotropic receptor 107 [Diabrotica virgifera virgifera]|nr:Ionotropic receptor 107 [Diabrotica virgifera virgifera]